MASSERWVSNGNSGAAKRRAEAKRARQRRKAERMWRGPRYELDAQRCRRSFSGPGWADDEDMTVSDHIAYKVETEAEDDDAGADVWICQA